MHSDSTVRVQYVSAPSGNISEIYKRHIEKLAVVLRIFAVILLALFGSDMIIFAYDFVMKTNETQEGFYIWLWAFTQLVNILAIATGILGIYAAKVQSRGSSLRFARLLTVFSEVFIVFLAVECFCRFEELQGRSQVNTIYYMICGLLAVGVLLRFCCEKAKQFHMLVTQAILDSTKASLEG
jgi:hypothetical protein